MLRATIASAVAAFLLPPMIAGITTTQPIATTQRVATTMPAQTISAWSEWPGFGGWQVASLTWSKTGDVQPTRCWVNFHYAAYPVWPTAFGVDQDDATNHVVATDIRMRLIGDLDGDGRVTTADYSAVKMALGAVAPDPNDYGG